MLKFTDCTTKNQYESIKPQIGLEIENVPGTEKNFESCRKYITMNGYRYFVSMNSEKDYYISCENDFSVWFSFSDNEICIIKSINNGRYEKADRYLKKYATLLCSIHAILKYEKCLKYVPYKAERV